MNSSTPMLMSVSLVVTSLPSMMTAGLAHRAASRGLPGALLGLAAATLVVEIGGVCVAILGDGAFDLAAAATRTLATLAVGLLALPLLLGVDRSLTRRRLA